MVYQEFVPKEDQLSSILSMMQLLFSGVVIGVGSSGAIETLTGLTETILVVGE